MKLSKYVLVALPIIELTLFIEVGSLMGSLSVILSIFITALLGYYLIKQKLRSIGLSVFNFGNFQDIYTEYTSNIYSIIAGVLLIIPGYLTDISGLIILLPFFKPRLTSFFDHKYGAKVKKNNVIEGNYRDDD